MSNPFPGMNPYLESPKCWFNFHTQFLVHLSDAINTLLPEKYCSIMEERVQNHSEEETIKYVQIIRPPHQKVSTVIELLSFFNKSKPEQTNYFKHREELLKQSVHLVELDLLKGGKRLSLGRPFPKGDHFALVSRADRRPNCEVYPWLVREPLSKIRIPLSGPDPDLIIDLQSLVDLTYDRGQFRRLIDYNDPIEAPFSEADKTWARQQSRLALA